MINHANHPVRDSFVTVLGVMRGGPILVAMFVLGDAVPARAATFTVNSTADAGDASPADTVCETAPGNGVCTLRAAIQEANALAGADTITLAAGIYTLTIPGRAEDQAVLGDLDITADLTINGAGAATTIIQACAPAQPDVTCEGIDRVFHVDPFGAAITVAIADVTIQNGRTAGIAFVGASGGGILLGTSSTFGPSPCGTLTLTNVVVQRNDARQDFGSAYGGGIANRGGTLIVARSVVSANGGWSGGGGIFNDFIGTVIVNDSTVSDNTAGEGGGLFSLQGGVTVTGSTFSGNQSGGFGGGISNYRSEVRITNSTFSGNNTIAYGGGIFNSQGVVTLNSSTITNNDAGTPQAGGSGGGIATYGAVTLSNTIIAGNRVAGAPADCSETLTSAGYNLIQSPFCRVVGDLTGNIIGQDARLGLLIDNGGPTRTHALLGTSPAIGAGSPAMPGSGGNACPAADQRGVPRPQPVGGRCDIGASELQGVVLTGMTPDHAGDQSPLVALVYGNGFSPGASVKLSRAGESDIVGIPTAVDERNTVVAAKFDITGRTRGLWDLVVTNPDGTSLTRTGALTVEESRAPQLWADVIGRAVVRVGRPNTFAVIFGNRGNVDALAVPLTLWSTADLGVPSIQIVPPPPQDGQTPTDWSMEPITAVPPPELSHFIAVPLLLPVVPAGFSGVIQVTFTPTPESHGLPFEIRVGIGSPYFKTDLDPEVVADLGVQARVYAERGLGVQIPIGAAPAVEQYIATQLQRVVADGRAAWVAGIGAMPPIYSSAHLLIDVALYGARLSN